jgi:hypothetical protein
MSLLSPAELREMKEVTYCERCEVVKVPRVHHCKECDHCILRMDHHCPWIGNCVGRNNHKFFILFLLYATVGLGIVWISVAIDGLSGWVMMSKIQSNIAQFLMGAAAVFALLLFLSIATLLISQIIMVVSNYTTLESFVPGVDDKVLE